MRDKGVEKVLNIWKGIFKLDFPFFYIYDKSIKTLVLYSHSPGMLYGIDGERLKELYKLIRRNGYGDVKIAVKEFKGGLIM